MQKLILPASVYNANARNANASLQALAETVTLEQAINSIPSNEQYEAKK